MPFFSIIIPIYNTPQEYFECCIKSLREQSFSDIEILLVDDGSHKECAEMCDEYARMDDRVKVIHQLNQGVSVARNNGIRAATADWIMFVDADDWLDSDACERLNAYLLNNSCDMLLFNAIKEYANKQEKMNYGFEHGCIYNTSDVDIREFIYRRAMQTPNMKVVQYCPVYYSWDKVFKRSWLLDNNLQYPVGLTKSEDKIFILRCFEKIRTLYYVEDVFYHYRINATSACNKYSDNADVDRIKLTELLSEIAERMDKELGKLKEKADYNQITKDYMRFIFGIISDVLFLKYYHPDYPYTKKERSVEVRKFLNTEPFKTSIRECEYNELTGDAKIKKFLLSVGFISVFCYMRKIRISISNKIAE